MTGSRPTVEVIAGLSRGVVVVQAAPSSGSLLTARHAAEQSCEVITIPGPPLVPGHRGTNPLLREGATLVEDAADIRRALCITAGSPAAKPAAPRPATRSPALLFRELRRAPHGGRRADGAGLRTPQSGPLQVDERIWQCHATGAAVLDALVELELAGRIERHPGDRVSLAST